MRVLFCGDVVGRAGRQIVVERVPELRRRLRLDVVVVNGENAAHGYGITAEICREFFDAGVDVITGGNHSWDRREIVPFITSDIRLLRPLNYPEGTPGWGAAVYPLKDGRNIMVFQVMGRLFMDPLDDPFAAATRALLNHRVGQSVDCIVVDIHAEATSEKASMGAFLDGRVSLVAGTHTHVPTADARILPGGTAYITDIGMCGDYDSVIGMDKEQAIARFIRKIPSGRLEPATGLATLAAVFLETDPATGLAKSFSPVRLGGHLSEHWPQ
ncbi:MAG: TIGR00282 family metallophosphoesterase [Rhodospirillales bacterium]|nr:MAG: TIGR00282 family metallophosphoesterase [Rhodospirillales bacterium]